MSELHKITTADGTEFSLNNGDTKFVLVPTPANMGLPPVSLQTERGYKQDGQTEVGLVVNPRTLQLQWYGKANDRAGYFDLRNQILDIARYNRGGLATYTFIRKDGTQRAIEGRLTSPTFPEGDPEQWSELQASDTIQIECHNPVWFNPTQVSLTGVQTLLGGSFQLPATPPITLGAGQYEHKVNFTYNGSWYERPTIVMTGVMHPAITIYHEELDIAIQFNGELASSEELTLDLAAMTLVSDVNGNRWTELAFDSDLVNFKIEPTPLVALGSNTLIVYTDTVDGNTNVDFKYYERFIGL